MRSEEILERINALPPRGAKLMEVCGTHTMSIARAGIKRLLPEGLYRVRGFKILANILSGLWELVTVFLGKALWVTLIPLGILFGVLLHADLTTEKELVDTKPSGH